jgi:lysophospholipid acyltransferase (LPLAT)-like uncharacterized protein
MLKRLLNLKIMSFIGLAVVRIISATYKVKMINPEIERNVLEKGQIPIYCSWHQRFFPGIILFARRKPISIMISRSRDGEIVSGIIQLLGWYPVRGSSSKGGHQALRKIKKLVREGYKIGHIVDGPRGPFGVVKPGLLLIAQTTGMPIIPIIISAEKKWVFNSWDRFIIPKPFSRVIIRFSNEVCIPRKLLPSAFEEKRSQIENTLKKLYIETDTIWSDADKARRLFNA